MRKETLEEWWDVGCKNRVQRHKTIKVKCSSMYAVGATRLQPPGGKKNQLAHLF